MRRVGLLSVLLTSSVARPVMAQAGSASALDSVRVAVHPFCQVRRCPPYFMVLRANGELTLAQDSAHTSIQLADSTVAHLLAIVHPSQRIFASDGGGCAWLSVHYVVLQGMFFAALRGMWYWAGS